MKCNFSSLHKKKSPTSFTIPNHLHTFITQTQVWNLYLTSMKMTWHISHPLQKKITSTLAPFLSTFTIPGVTSLAKLKMQKEKNKKMLCHEEDTKPWRVLYVNILFNQHILRIINNPYFWSYIICLKYYWPFNPFPRKSLFSVRGIVTKEN